MAERWKGWCPQAIRVGYHPLSTVPPVLVRWCFGLRLVAHKEDVDVPAKGTFPSTTSAAAYVVPCPVYRGASDRSIINLKTQTSFLRYVVALCQHSRRTTNGRFIIGPIAQEMTAENVG